MHTCFSKWRQITERSWLLNCLGIKSAVVLPVALFFTSATYSQTIIVDTTQPVNSFRPAEALGAGVDRIPLDATDKVFTEPILKQILSTGWQTVTYRQNTELFVEAWHWNPNGTWSGRDKTGYFTGDSNPTEFIRHSFGYPLPHAGFSEPDGNSYSRLTDGDVNTYWKSNPYLTKAYTGEDDSLHPQWVVVDLATQQEINAIRVDWADPYAKKYRVQYWTGVNPIEEAAKGSWVTFAGGEVTNGKGGAVTLQLSRAPLSVRWVRIWMTESSNTCDTHGSEDRRNCLGYGIKELYLGTTTADGQIHDVIRHTSDRAQTNTYCSSVDPWHESTVMNQHSDQVGFDLFYTSGITRGLPAMVPVAMLYDTPENAVAQIQYLKKRGYPISYIEMGEEPDGKHTLPEDYAALYLQWATALHKVDPNLKLGGPIFEGVNKDIEVWPTAEGKTSWMGRFFDYLRSHNRLKELSFISFEHYPFEACKLQWSELYEEADLTRHILQVWRDDGLPPGTPMFITETNIAPGGDESFVDIFAALWWADFVGSFFEAGGNAVYYFHYIPLGQSDGCHNTSPGTFSMFTMNKNYEIQQPTSQYFAGQMITKEWVQPGNGEHRVFRSSADVIDGANHVLVTAYAVKRPDGDWSLMIVNKDQLNEHPVRISFRSAENAELSHFVGPVAQVTFGSEQYKWHSDASNPIGGVADPDGPPTRSTLTAGNDTVFNLPKASVTVLRGHIAVR
ncbi:MAG: discoidin domain-containing protein [Acidobacteriota bacterium]|nr:discoidin domain-containing protein [Acidobacteriota bacterium]